MGRLVLEEPGARERISAWCEQPGMYGMRFSFNRPQLIAPLVEGRIDWLWEEAEKARVPVMALVTHDLIGLMDGVAARHPDLKLALCHLALPTEEKDEEAFRGVDKLFQIARRPNVMVKVSGLPSYTSEPYPFRGLQGYVKRVYDVFGPRRMFWGTDFSRLSCTYEQAVTMFTEEMTWLSTSDLECIMGRGLCEWLGWPLPQPAG
jgi:predicted TIM-barrel fold metal-dependent hydrolase